MDKFSILVVDDEVSILNSVRRLLRKENCLVRTALGADSALRILEEEDIRLIISDKNMPGMNGLEFLKHVKRHYPKVLTIMLTGNADLPSAVVAINDAGVFKYIQKPWDNQLLVFTVRQALRYLSSDDGRSDPANHSIKTNDILLRELERDYPGITRIVRDDDGYIIG